MNQRRGLHAFTLVELLVVIAIVAILISILLGPIIKVRRRALVLACPIVRGTNTGSVELLHPHGAQVEIEAPNTLCWNSYLQGPHWSPSGMHLGYTLHVPNVGGGYHHELAIAEPSSGQVLRFASVFDSADRFPGWADSEHFIEVGDDGQTVVVRSARTGAVIEKYNSPKWKGDRQHIAPVPGGIGAAYVSTSNAGGGVLDIVLLRKDFSIRRVIYSETDFIANPSPRVDPFGEYVAWSGKDDIIRVKSLHAPRSAEPETFGGSFYDWTEDGKILAGRGGHLVLLSRNGKLVANVPISSGLAYYNGTAAWRKYTHQ